MRLHSLAGPCRLRGGKDAALVRQRELGRFAGHCPGCGSLVGSRELGRPCARCGRPLKEEELVSDIQGVHRQSKRQHDQANIEFVKDAGHTRVERPRGYWKKSGE